MIGRLSGQLASREPDRVLVETAGGVGYEVLVAPRTLMDLPEPKSQVTLHIHTQVSETAIVLYGFPKETDRHLFRVVQLVKGVGPKLALAIVGTTEPSALASAIAQEDLVGLVKIPGLGKKTAARMCLELKDRLDELMTGSDQGQVVLARTEANEPASVADARAALAALGYNGKEIKKALAAAAPGPDDTVQTVLRRALKSLSPA